MPDYFLTHAEWNALAVHGVAAIEARPGWTHVTMRMIGILTVECPEGCQHTVRIAGIQEIGEKLYCLVQPTLSCPNPKK